MVDLKIFAQTIEPEAVAQIEQMAAAPVAEGSKIRIMPDCHAGKGCTIGTTMTIHDRVCPNLVGVDIACGVMLSWDARAPKKPSWSSPSAGPAWAL